jgi:hypothetical protein
MPALQQEKMNCFGSRSRLDCAKASPVAEQIRGDPLPSALIRDLIPDLIRVDPRSSAARHGAQ